MRRRINTTLLLAVAATCLAGAATYVYWYCHTPRAVRWLGTFRSAVRWERREVFDSDRIWMVADATPEEFRDLVSRLGLERKSADQGLMAWERGTVSGLAYPAWWDPEPSMAETYVNRGEPKLTYMKYERGRIYYDANP